MSHRYQRRSSVFLLPAAMLLMSFLVAGCASVGTPSECTSLQKNGQGIEDLLRLEKLNVLNPNSSECRRVYIQIKDQVVWTQLKKAERLRDEGLLDEAAEIYRTVMQLSPGNDLAREALQQIESRKRAQKLLDEARDAIDRREWALAQSLLDTVLRAEPANAEAKKLFDKVAEATALPAADEGLKVFFRKPISIDFRDAPVRQIFDVMSMVSGLNFVFDKDVKTDQKTSIVLRNSTIESVLHFVLLANQLDYQAMNGNTLLVYPNIPTKQKEYQELSVRSFQMANADVKSVAAALKVLFKGREFFVDEKQNMLVVRDTPEALRVVEKLVAMHDVAEPEVMLEVAILEVSRKRLQNLGVNLPTSLELSPLATAADIGLTLADLTGLSKSTIGAKLPSTTLNLKREDTDVNILANPRIRVVNREKAKILVGDKVPVVSVTATPQLNGTPTTAETITYTDIGLKLEVEPIIYRGNDIVIKVGLEVSNISGSTLGKYGNTIYTFGERTANTTLRLRDGENQILAGLINDDDRKTVNRLPLVGQMPVVGRLFGNSDDQTAKTEIVLSITPRLVRNVPRAEGTLREFRSGTESSFRERPAPATPVPVAAQPAPASVPPITPTAIPLAATPPSSPMTSASAPPDALDVPRSDSPASPSARQPSLDAKLTRMQADDE